jgi:uncharacterized protein (DUF362 family)/Pyruvate/2-oxoacid:ferredoxin oxidoreductase delta subunit
MGDSPGSGLPYTEDVLQREYAVSGYKEVSQELGIPLNYDTDYGGVDAPSARLRKRFSIIKPAMEADALVVVSKAKTHPLTYLTGAAKNIFGLVPGLEKPVYHAKYRNADDFGRVMVDLNELMKPRLQVMDAIMAMEGDGPHNGSPRKLGALLASGDYSAIDVATARIMSIDPLKVSTISEAVARGYLRSDLGDVVIVGDPLESLIVGDYKPPSTYNDSRTVEAHRDRLSSFISSIQPRILEERCVGCLKCLRSCPVKAIRAVNKKPSIDYKKCIRCYCCQEMCDDHAIVLERGISVSSTE